MQLINYKSKMRKIKICDKIQYFRLCDLLGIQNGNLRLSLRTILFIISTEKHDEEKDF